MRFQIEFLTRDVWDGDDRDNQLRALCMPDREFDVPSPAPKCMTRGGIHSDLFSSYSLPRLQ